MSILINLFLLALGFIMLMKGADWFVDGAAGIAEKLGIPQLVIGLTIVAMGTSAPEAAVSITAALKGNAGISIGNVVGSNILNILIILGVTAVICTLAIQKSTLYVEIPYMILISVLLLLLGRTGNTVSRLEGVFLWVLFIIYLVYLFFLARKGTQEKEEKKEEKSLLKLIVLLIIGGIIVVVGSDVTVDAATNLAKCIGLDDRFIGLTIVALGTSLPELVTSVNAARKKNADIAIGNIVGSNIFNILFVIGTSALIIPIPFASTFVIDALIAIFSGVLLWIAVLRTRTLKRFWGILMLVAYGGYFIYLLK